MKKKMLLLICFECFALSGFSQKIDPLAPTTPITWLGIDFSGARFIGDYYKFNSLTKTRELFDDLNDLMVGERDKYDVGKMLGKSNVRLNMGITKKHNASLDVAALLADSLGLHQHLKLTDIQDIVKNYDFGNEKGIGLLYIVESFNKKISRALIWVTFVDMETKEVLVGERMSQEPGGFGLRNYWAGAIDDMMRRVRKSELSKWRAKATPK